MELQYIFENSFQDKDGNKPNGDRINSIYFLKMEYYHAPLAKLLLSLVFLLHNEIYLQIGNLQLIKIFLKMQMELRRVE